MKYENFEGPVEDLVRMKIKEIEEKEHIRVLHVVESGSRADLWKAIINKE